MKRAIDKSSGFISYVQNGINSPVSIVSVASTAEVKSTTFQNFTDLKNFQVDLLKLHRTDEFKSLFNATVKRIGMTSNHL